MDRFLVPWGATHVISKPFPEGERCASVTLLLLNAEYGAKPPPELLSQFRFLASLLKAYYDFAADPEAALHPAQQKRYGLLSEKEREALVLVSEGRTPAQAAAEMGVSETTARKHLNLAARKLNASTRDEAVAAAQRLGLLQPLKRKE